MSTQEARGPHLRGYRRRKAVLDLNVPPVESRYQEGSSTQNVPPEVNNQPVQPVAPATIDVEALDDDVIESSPRAFAEAKNNSRRSHARRVVVDLDSGRTARLTNNSRSKNRRIPPNQTVINLESSAPPKKQNDPQPPPPLKEPTFTCPICMSPLVEEMSTRCGHIFCKSCIKSAIAAQGKCPTCRKRVTVKELIRIFLPSASSV